MKSDPPPALSAPAPVPNIPAAALAKIGEIFARDLTAADMAEALRAALELDADGESLLFTQSQVLDGLFHRLVNQALGSKNFRNEEFPEHLNLDRLALALRTQKQCRAALHTLNTVRAWRKLLAKK